MLEVYRTRSIEWRPSPVVALATSPDESQVAAARSDGSVEIWLVSPGSVGWHCQLTIYGDPGTEVSSLVWCLSGSGGLPSGRLFSSSHNGSVYEWDLFDLRQKTVLDSIGVSISQMAVAPYNGTDALIKQEDAVMENGHSNGKLDSAEDQSNDSKSDSESESEDETDELRAESATTSSRVAVACEDGCVRIYSISGLDNFTYNKSLPRVSGRVLSVTWSPDSNIIYSGSSDGFIRCWDANLMHEVYRITAGLGGLGCGPELCVLSLLALRNGTLVSADSTGTVQFWDSQHGTLMQAQSFHKGEVNALAAVPSHNRVFSAGSDGQVVLYKLSTNAVGCGHDNSSSEVKKWVYIGYVRAHTHDVKSLTVAVPISQEDLLPDEKVKRLRGAFSYRKWAQKGVPMLISAGDDTKIFAYSANEFSKFSPHDICPAPQRVPIQLVLNADLNQSPLLLVQGSYGLDILSVRVKNNTIASQGAGFSCGHASTDLVAHIKSYKSKKVICSTISPSGLFVAYSNHASPRLYELKRQKHNVGGVAFTVNKKDLPSQLPYAHSLVFSSDSSRLMIAGHDRRIYVVDMERLVLCYIFTPCHTECSEELQQSEPPITKMFTSSDGQWLAAVNCFGDIYIFNLETQRQHWFISRLDGASVTAGGFTPQNSNVLIISTSSNQVYAFDVEAKQLGEWSMQNSFLLPRRFQEFPGEVIGLSFVPSPKSSSLVIYSARALCIIDFGMPIDEDDVNDLKVQDLKMKKTQNGYMNGTLKRKLREHEREAIHGGRKNFEFCAFRNPILFLGHLSKNSIFVIEKSWMQVVRTFETLPVHKHIYGT